MKRILFIFTMMLAFGVTAQAQDKKASAASKARQEAVEMTDFLKLNSTELDSFTRLFQMKHETLENPNINAAKKKEMSVIVEKKIEASLDGNQIEKLRANKTLWEKLTH